MGKVAISIKVLPESPEADMERIVEEIKNKIEVRDVKIEPFVFGLKVIKLLVVREDAEGSEEVENALRSIKGVGEVEVESLTLL